MLLLKKIDQRWLFISSDGCSSWKKFVIFSTTCSKEIFLLISETFGEIVDQNVTQFQPSQCLPVAASKSFMDAYATEIIVNKSLRYRDRALIVFTSQRWAETMEKLIVTQLRETPGGRKKRRGETRRWFMLLHPPSINYFSRGT